MPRIRTIKPEFWQNEKLSLTLPETRLLAIGLLNFCDDDGYFKYHPSLLKSWIFPYSTTNNIHDFCIELEAIEYLVFFQDKEGEIFGKINKFEIHQKINRKVDSKIKELDLDHYSLSESSVSPHAQLTHTSLPERKGKERKGKERINNGQQKKSNEDEDLENKFNDFWKEYKRHEGKAQSKKIFIKLIKKKQSIFLEIMNGLKMYNQYLEVKGWEKDFILKPEKFLKNEEFYNDYSTNITNWDFYNVEK